MWIVATDTKFTEYGVTITTQRQLADGEYIMHLELNDMPTFFLDIRFDADVKMLSDAQMNEIIKNEPQPQEG